MSSNKPQDSMFIPMHKRIAMGEKLDGTTLQSRGSGGNKSKGGLPAQKKK